MKINPDNLLRQIQYADLKGVSAQHIGKLIKDGKLITSELLGVVCVVDCPANDAQFMRPAHNRKINQI